MKLSKYLNLFFILGLVMIMTNTSCGLFDEDEDPKIDVQVGDTLWVHDMTVGDVSLYLGPSLAYDDNNATAYYSKSGETINWTPSVIVAVDATNGAQKWESPALDGIGLSSNIVIGDDGTIYAIGYTTLYAINPSNGQFKWTWEVPTELTHSNGDPAYTYGRIGSLSLLNSGDLILGSIDSGVYSRGIYCVSPAGIMKWYNLDANGWGVGSAIAVDANDNAYYYTALGGKHNLISINGTTGVVRWNKEIISSGGVINNIVIDPNGSLICSFILNSGEPYYMYQLNSQNGEIQWKNGEEVNFSTKLIGTDGKIYQTNYGGVFTFTAGDGQKSAFGSLNSDIRGAVINSDNQLVIVHNTDFVSSINTYDPNGTSNWHVGYSGIDHRYMIITDDDKIILFKSKGVIAFQGNASEATSGWPSVNHDYKNTNNVLK